MHVLHITDRLKAETSLTHQQIGDNMSQDVFIGIEVDVHHLMFLFTSCTVKALDSMKAVLKQCRRAQKVADDDIGDI
jgi:hypothetical protein